MVVNGKKPAKYSLSSHKASASVKPYTNTALRSGSSPGVWIFSAICLFKHALFSAE